MRQPGYQPARRDGGLGGNAAIGAEANDPFERQPAARFARGFAAGGIEIAQPAEAVQLARPRGARRLDDERRAAAQKGVAPGQAELAVLHLMPEAGVGRAQILRNDEQVIDRRRLPDPAAQRTGERAHHGRPLARLVDRQRRLAQPVFQRQFRHASPSRRQRQRSGLPPLGGPRQGGGRARLCAAPAEL